MATVGDNREQDVIAGLGRSFAHFDRLDAGIENGLVVAESLRRFRGQDLAPAGRNVRYLHMLAKIIGHHHIGKAPEHGNQFRHVHEARKAADGFVFA